MPSAILGPVAGAVVGGLMGGSDGGGQQVSKDPWEPAQPWLRENLRTGQALQNYYQQNPFNQIQRTSYQNMLGDIDNFRQNINPGLMAFANRLMNTNYSRNGGIGNPMNSMGMGAMPSPQVMPNAMAQGVQGGGNADAGGLLGGMFDAQMAARGAPRQTMGNADAMIAAAGLLGNGATMAGMPGNSMPSGPFSAPAGQAYGLLDWNELNPFTATNGIRMDVKPVETGEEKDRKRKTDEEKDNLRKYMESERGSAGA